VRYVGSTIVIGDDACYCQFEAPSSVAVVDVNRRVGLPVDRIVPRRHRHTYQRRIPMSIATTVPANIEITRRKLAGLIAVTTAAAAALTWAVATVAIDTTAEPTRTTTPPAIQYATLGIPLGPIAAPAAQVVADAQPIAVADAYHGVGVTVCLDGAQPINVADSYHGVGVTVCVGS
jgi:Protein of unknown function (DUF4242)